MSAKWVRSKAWEREHLTGPWTPVRWLVHTFSTIWFAVILLSLVAVYGILASVPIGVIALAPTWLFYGFTVVVALAVGAFLPTWGVVRMLRAAGVGRGGRFAIGLVAALVLAVLTLWAWRMWAWPVLHYDRVSGRGVMFFASFIERWKDVTVRRLPGMEMSELEFYSWWPLKVVLLAFVVNMIVATVRRIEFIFVNLGVLTVHAGIVVLALGSVYYSGAKLEGDTILMAGEVDPRTGAPEPGNMVQGFFDNTRTVLRLRQTPSRDPNQFEQRELIGLPRYNDYNLAVLGQRMSARSDERGDEGRTLDVEVPPAPRPDGATLIDPDIHVRVVGYASYAEMRPTWRQATPPANGTPVPTRFVELLSSIGSDSSQAAVPGGEQRLIRAFPLLPTIPAGRLADMSGVMFVELTRNMPESRWQELSANLPADAANALIVEVPDQKISRIYPVQAGQVITVGGEGGAPLWRLEVRALQPQPPFPIITRGYENARSSVAIVRVTPPTGGAYERYVYHRFPELNQDLLDEKQPNGMPKRRAADSAIRIGYLDASPLQVYIDEQIGPDGTLTARAIVREPGKPPKIVTGLGDGSVIPVVPVVSLRLGERWAHSEQVLVPRPVPEADRTEREAIGTHRRAAVAVEVSQARPGAAPWKTVQWVPFTQYFNFEGDGTAPVQLPDGRLLEVAFGRLYIPFPDRMALQLKDFEMIPYPHSTQPRDYRSDLMVYRVRDGSFVASEHSSSLNEPLKISPFMWSSERSWPTNALGWLASKIGATQFKFSQAGWDSRGWTQTRTEVESGTRPRAVARFTILGVGNNPGIYIIAAGAVMVVLGTPWAFYVKPWILRMRKTRIQRQLAAEGKLPGMNGAGQATKNPPIQTGGGAAAPAGVRS